MLEHLIDNNNTFFYLSNSYNYTKYPQRWNKNRNCFTRDKIEKDIVSRKTDSGKIEIVS